MIPAIQELNLLAFWRLTIIENQSRLQALLRVVLNKAQLKKLEYKVVTRLF